MKSCLLAVKVSLLNVAELHTENNIFTLNFVSFKTFHHAKIFPIWCLYDNDDVKCLKNMFKAKSFFCINMKAPLKPLKNDNFANS